MKLALRDMEALRLYRPLAFQEAFHASKAPERIIRGGNRSGKTCAAAAEVARALTGQDPHDKYPKTDGICYCVGQDGREVAQVLYALLFKPGGIRIIRDIETREWRAYNPTNPQDIGRFKETKPAPPFIPKRFVQSIAWEDKSGGLPKTITLTTGWVVHFYSQNALPTRGTSIDIGFFDEEVRENDYYAEVAARLVDREGKFIWSATPQAGTERLYALHERAEAEGGIWIDGTWTGGDSKTEKPAKRTIEEFFCTIESNRYMSADHKAAFAKKFLEDEQNYRVRIGGEFAILSGRVYPEYSPSLHEVDPFKIPLDWTRYAAIDPGRQVCAVLFAAVPPTEVGDFVYLYDELYIRNCSAALFGQEMAKKKGDQWFQAFLIDMSEARKHDTGSGKKILEQYMEALEANNVSCELSGYGFIAGNDNTKAGIEAMRSWLRWRPDGTSKARIFRTCTNLIKEIKHYRNKSVRGEFVDEPVKKNDHLTDCGRYLAQYGPTWIPGKKREPKPSGAYAAFLRDQEKETGGSVLMLGAGAFEYGSQRY